MPSVAATKDAKDDKDDSILTPAKDARQDQWWGSSPSEYVVDTTITNGRITRILCVGSLVGLICLLEQILRAPSASHYVESEESRLRVEERGFLNDETLRSFRSEGQNRRT